MAHHRAARKIYPQPYGALLEALESRLLLSALPAGFSPAQVRHAYGFDQVAFNVNGKSVVADGRGQTIAIVDAMNDPNISSDLDTFDKMFSLGGSQSLYQQYGAAATFFSKAMPEGLPATDAGWSLEISLDVEWAHAIAPGAKVLLVEAKSSSSNDLLNAVNYARNQPNVSTVSMSWGGGEFSSEAYFDSYFTTPQNHTGVSFVAASGDAGAPAEWPAVSPDVVAVGGTAMSISTSGNYLSETGWRGSGGGPSIYEAKPGFQNSVSGGKRTSPDVAYDANPGSGYAVYDSVKYGNQSGWFIVDGTSAGAPQWSALLAVADEGRALAGLGTLDSGSQTLPALYTLPAADFHDILSGNNGYAATTGYDRVTGRGTPIANQLIPALVAFRTTNASHAVVAAANSNVISRPQGTNVAMNVSQSPTHFGENFLLATQTGIGPAILLSTGISESDPPVFVSMAPLTSPEGVFFAAASSSMAEEFGAGTSRQSTGNSESILPLAGLSVDLPVASGDYANSAVADQPVAASPNGLLPVAATPLLPVEVATRLPYHEIPGGHTTSFDFSLSAKSRYSSALALAAVLAASFAADNRGKLLRRALRSRPNC